MKKFALLPSLVLSGCVAVAQNPSFPPLSPGCNSLHPGSQFSAPKTLTLPVARFPQSKAGTSALILPGQPGTGVKTFWVANGKVGKHVVAYAQGNNLNLSPLHNLNRDRYPRVVVVAVIPADALEAGLTLTPALEERESQWLAPLPYRSTPSVAGFIHPFSGLETPDLSRPLPPRLAQALAQIPPGAIAVPSGFPQLRVSPPQRYDSLCPPTN